MQNLVITTFNIRCFGFNGDYFAKQKAEHRIPFLKKFILENYKNSDLFILQEIMDPSVLNQVLPVGFKHYTYAHDYERHMFITLCCRHEFDFKDLTTIANTALDKTTSRPALYGCLYKGKKPLAHVIGVHLKSGYDHTENRIAQAQNIVTFMDTLNKDLPFIMAGDFNSHIKDKTRKNQDDLFFLNHIFQQKNLIRANQNDLTYITAFEGAHLDHFWTNAKVNDINVYNYKHFSKEPIKDYFNQISDHLPVTVNIEL